MNRLMPARGWSALGGKKYWIIFTNSLQTSMAHRANFFAMFFAEGLSLIVMIYLWLSIYHQGNHIGTYSLRDLVAYYIFSKFVILVISSQDFAREVAMTIRDGNFTSYLTKPISFFGQMVSVNAAYGVQRLFIFSAVAFFVFLLFLGFPGVSLATVAVFLLACMVGYTIFVLMNFLIGVTIFFVGFVSGFNFLMAGIAAFFSGRLVPLDILPVQYSQIADLLPFKYSVYIPTAIVTGKITPQAGLIQISHGLIWIVILGAFTLFYYRRGLKKFESYGS